MPTVPRTSRGPGHLAAPLASPPDRAPCARASSWPSAARLALLVTLAGCGCAHSPSAPASEPAASSTPATASNVEAPPPAETPGAPAESVAAAESDAHANDFGFRLFDRLRATPGNLVFSPASVRVALAMAYAGARGETADEMARTLAIAEGDRASVHRTYGNALRTWNATRTVTLRVANRAFVERTTAIVPSFLALTRDAYGAEARAVDFVHAFEPARLEVNEWVASQTERRIQDLLPPGSIDATTRVVLANAVYFNGKWKTRFDPARTEPMPFTLGGGGSASVHMMQTRARFAYARLPDGVRVLEMPYEGDELRMVWLLPETADGIAELEARVDTATLARWRAATSVVDVEVGIPRFRMEPPTIQLGRLLAQMGMPRAFDGRADFTGIAGDPGDLQISDVFHRAFIDVNEQGTEAAAATAVVMGRGLGMRPEPARFYADHPFLFALVDQRTDTVLFFGRVSDPR